MIHVVQSYDDTVIRLMTVCRQHTMTDAEFQLLSFPNLTLGQLSSKLYKNPIGYFFQKTTISNNARRERIVTGKGTRKGIPGSTNTRLYMVYSAHKVTKNSLS